MRRAKKLLLPFRPLGKAGSIPAPYLGPIAAGSICAWQSFNSTNKQSMSARYCVAFENITSLQIILTNWYLSGANMVETAPGAAATCTAAVWSSGGSLLGVFTFGGSQTGNIPDGGQVLSDALPISISAGTAFYIRVWKSCSAGITYTSLARLYSGEGMNFGATTPDITQSGSGFSVSGNYYGPAAILGMTTRASVCVIGDSRAYGQNDNADATGRMGEITRSLTTTSFLNASVPGAKAASFPSGAANRIALSQYCTHIICQLGVNDIGSNAAALITQLTSNVYPQFSGKKIWQTTLIPHTGSTDSWATVANQTDSTSGARATFNTAVRAGLSGTAGYFDMTTPVENTLNGVWQVDGTANKYTADGLHEQPFAYAQIAAAGLINQALFTR